MHRLALIDRLGFDPLPDNADEQDSLAENIIRELPSTGLDIPPADEAVEAVYRAVVILAVVLAAMGIWYVVLWFLKSITTG